MTRDELISAAWRDLTRPRMKADDIVLHTIDAVEPLIRADERERYQGRRDGMMRALSEELLHVRTKTLADLRAQVLAVDPVEWALAGMDAPRIVLALIDGVSE